MSKRTKKKKRKKKVKTAPRNPFVLPARQRKAGPHKNPLEKRQNENKNDKRFLDEDYDNE